MSDERAEELREIVAHQGQTVEGQKEGDAGLRERASRAIQRSERAQEHAKKLRAGIGAERTRGRGRS